MIIEKLVPGSFCWMELATTDQSAAKNFYSSLFGWTATDYPMGPDGDYTVFRLKDRDCGAAYTMRKEHQEKGIPPNWILYIGVSNADQSTKRAAELGATVLAGPFDVMDKGRMSVIQDPTGAHFCLWQAATSTGIGIGGEENTFCWADINSLDRDSAVKFYSALMGWKFDAGEGKDEAGYLHIVNGDQMIGGAPPATMLPPDMPAHWMIYYMVSDCAASTAKVESLGGRVFKGSMEVEGAGKFSIVTDPQGAVFALFQPTMM